MRFEVKMVPKIVRPLETVYQLGNNQDINLVPMS